MPLFEFTCRQCGRSFETLVIGSRKAVCPSCSSEDLEKLYSRFGTRSSAPRAAVAVPSRFT